MQPVCDAPSADATLARVLAIQLGNSGIMPTGALAGRLTASCWPSVLRNYLSNCRLPSARAAFLCRQPASAEGRLLLYAASIFSTISTISEAVTLAGKNSPTPSVCA